MSTSVTTIDLLRHGEPEGSDGFRGHSDFVLTQNGWHQLRSATTANSPPWQVVVTSPLRRCAEFAREFAQQHALPLFVEEDLREISFGEWDGKSFEEVRKRWPDEIRIFTRNPAELTPPNGESLQQLADRVMPAWQHLTERHRGQHVLVVAHGGVNRVLLGAVLGIPLSHLNRLHVPYAGLARIQIFHHEKHPPYSQLIFMNGSHR